MAIELQVNPNTVQRAYDELVRDGLIYSQRGKGLFVADPRDSVGPRPRDGGRSAGRLRKGVRAGRSAGLDAAQLRQIFESSIDGIGAVEEPTVMSNGTQNGPAIELTGLTKFFGYNVAVNNLSL